MCCGKSLTDEFSMLTKLGKICARHMKIEYITDASQAERLRNDYLKRVDEIGEMEFWVPKKQILLWSDNVTKSMVDSMF
jgi:nucleoside-triphosphatase THEP1